MAKKILILEDELHVVNYLKNIFEDNGYQTMAAPDGEEGYRLMEQHRPDLITLDLQMPHQRGTKFYQRFRKDERFNQIPIIVISGQASPHRAIQPSKVAAIITKPFQPEDLVETVKKVIGEP